MLRNPEELLAFFQLEHTVTVVRPETWDTVLFTYPAVGFTSLIKCVGGAGVPISICQVAVRADQR